MGQLPVSPDLLAMLSQFAGLRQAARERERSRAFAQDDLQMVQDQLARQGEANLASYQAGQQARQAQAERAAAMEMIERKIEADREKQEREQAFELQKIGAKKRISGTPTGRAQMPFAAIEAPRGDGRAVIRGPAGVLVGDRQGIRRSISEPGVTYSVDPATGAISPQPRAPAPMPGLGFGVRGFRDLTGETDVDPEIAAQEAYLEARAHQIPADQLEGLRALVAAGSLKSNQLINQIEDALRPVKQEGRTLRDVQISAARLRAAADRQTLLTDPDGTVRKRLLARAEEEERRAREMREGTNPIRGQSITTNPAPQPGGKIVTREIVREFIEAAGGDKEEARALAREAGFVWPES